MFPIMNFVGNLAMWRSAFWALTWRPRKPSRWAISRPLSSTFVPSPSRSRRLRISPTSCQQTAAAAERVFEFLAEQEEIPDVENPVPPDKVKGHVVFDHVQFGYSPDKVVIRDFSADVQPGQRIAIVGPTGAGKTTMVKLLMRFYDVDRGAILIDGHNIKEFSRAELRCMFGMVLQDTWLYNDTIMENIRYGSPGASDDQVVAAAKAARVDHFVRTLPEGYGLVLNEEATNISQGQKTALDHRAGHLDRSQDVDSGRSYELGRYPYRSSDPGRHVRPDEGSHQFHHRSPTVDHPQRQSDSGDERWRYRGTGPARGIVGTRRLLRRSVQQSVRICTGAKRDAGGWGRVKCHPANPTGLRPGTGADPSRDTLAGAHPSDTAVLLKRIARLWLAFIRGS